VLLEEWSISQQRANTSGWAALHAAVSRMRYEPPGVGSATSTDTQSSIASRRLRSSSMISPWVAHRGIAGTSAPEAALLRIKHNDLPGSPIVIYFSLVVKISLEITPEIPYLKNNRTPIKTGL
jgi:hypothetical protein